MGWGYPSSKDVVTLPPPIFSNHGIESHLLRKLEKKFFPILFKSPIPRLMCCAWSTANRIHLKQMFEYGHNRLGKLFFTYWGVDPFFPMMNNIIPSHIGSNSIQCGHFGFVWREHESSMFEGDNISRLWIPSLCKLCCSCWCYKSNPIRPDMEIFLSYISQYVVLRTIHIPMCLSFPL